MAVAQNYRTGAPGYGWWLGDFNGDRGIGFADLVIVAQHYGEGYGGLPEVPGASAQFERDLAAAFASVPEPGGMAALAAAFGVLVGRRRRR